MITAFGGERTNLGTISQTDYGYTGQRDLDPSTGSGQVMGLMDYKARFYSPLLGRFVQPDGVTPGGPQGLNRYSYVNNNPVNFNDPTGHMMVGNGDMSKGCIIKAGCNTNDKRAQKKYSDKKSKEDNPSVDLILQNGLGTNSCTASACVSTGSANYDSSFGGIDLDYIFTLIPTYSEDIHLQFFPILDVYDIYASVGFGYTQGDGPIGVYRDALVVGQQTFSTDGYSTTTLQTPSSGGRQPEIETAVGGKFTWDAIGVEIDHNILDRRHTTSGTIGYEQDIAFRFEWHPQRALQFEMVPIGIGITAAVLYLTGGRYCPPLPNGQLC